MHTHEISEIVEEVTKKKKWNICFLCIKWQMILISLHIYDSGILISPGSLSFIFDSVLIFCKKRLLQESIKRL